MEVNGSEPLLLPCQCVRRPTLLLMWWRGASPCSQGRRSPRSQDGSVCPNLRHHKVSWESQSWISWMCGRKKE